jgi:hypothetical protein
MAENVWAPVAENVWAPVTETYLPWESKNGKRFGKT